MWVTLKFKLTSNLNTECVHLHVQEQKYEIISHFHSSQSIKKHFNLHAWNMVFYITTTVYNITYVVYGFLSQNLKQLWKGYIVHFISFLWGLVYL